MLELAFWLILILSLMPKPFSFMAAHRQTLPVGDSLERQLCTYNTFWRQTRALRFN